MIVELSGEHNQGEVRHCGQILVLLIAWLWKTEFASLFRILEGVRDFGYLHFVSVVSVS